MNKMDLYTYLKENVINIHKKPADSTYINKAKITRINATNDIRRETRDTLLLKKRNIPESLSPFLSPAVSQQKKQENRPVKNQPKEAPLNKRLQMLEKWKIERAKKKLAKKQKSKPLFKVCHVKEDIGLPKLDQVNKVVKGKPFKSKFAPANHIFQAPKNVKPIVMGTRESSNPKKIGNQLKIIEPLAKDKSAARKKTAIKEKVSLTKSSIVTRQQSKKETQCPNGLRPAKINNKNTIKSPHTPKKSSHQPPSRTPKLVAVNTKLVVSTEGGHSENTSVYISPFVTISRGKDKARKEFKVRQSSGGTFLDNIDGTSPQAAAEYFTKKLDAEIARIEEICSSWDAYKQENDLPEEIHGMIDVAIGQSKLLISKKFPQFRSLIEKCRSSNCTEQLVTCQDLHGYWDTAYIQVEDLDKRFNNLNTLKQNNWQEILLEKQEVVLKKSRTRPKKAETSSKLKDLIKAARNMKKKQETQQGTSDGSSSSGQQESERLRTPTGQDNKQGSVRKSLRVSMLNGKLQKKRLSSSPGLTMLRISQIMKFDTPNKSILKTDRTPSKSKSVLFRDDFNERSLVDTNDCGVNKENVDNIDGAVFSSPMKMRRSSRRSQNINN